MDDKIDKLDSNFFNDILKNITIIPTPEPKCKICGDSGNANYYFEYEDGKRYKKCICEIKMDNLLRYENFIKNSNMMHLKEMTFKAFKPQTAIQKQAFEAISENHRGYYLFGNYGVGKSHLMYASAFKAMAEGIPSALYSVPFLLKEIRNNQGTKIDIEKMAYEIPYLILDDIGKENSTSWVNERLSLIIDERWKRFLSGECHTSFTSQFPIDKKYSQHLGNFVDGSIISRIQGMCKVKYINGEDWRLK